MIRDQELVGLAMTLGRDAKIKITVGGEESCCSTDGSHINIAQMPSTPLGRMLMTGLVFHEIGHKNHTTGSRPSGLLGDMMNVIEDVRVDMETIKARPGTCFNLEAITTHYMNKGSLAPATFAQALLGKVMAYGIGRVLKQKSIMPLETVCNEMIDDAFGTDFIDDVENIIKGIPKLRSTRDTNAMARKLIELLVYQPPPPNPKPKPNPSQQQDESQQGQGQGDQCHGLGHGQCHQQQTEDQHQENPVNHHATGTGGDGAGTGGGKRPTPEEIAEMLKNSTGYGDLSKLIQAELDQIASAIPQSVLDGIPILPEIGRLKPGSSKLNEVEALSAASRMRAKMMGMLQSLKMMPRSHGLSGRKLAPGRLVKLGLGDPRIFRKKVSTVTTNTAVTVLLDLSGSMDDKCQVANAAAFALHTTLSGLKGVAVCSMEFSGKDNDPDVNILVDFGAKPLSENFNHRPSDGTPTATAIWAARAMLLQRTEPRKIMLILTDGCPDCDNETCAATDKAMKDGIEIAAIGIMHTGVRRLWENHRIIQSLQELPAAMFGVMEELLTSRR